MRKQFLKPATPPPRSLWENLQISSFFCNDWIAPTAGFMPCFHAKLNKHFPASFQLLSTCFGTQEAQPLGFCASASLQRFLGFAYDLKIDFPTGLPTCPACKGPALISCQYACDCSPEPQMQLPMPKEAECKPDWGQCARAQNRAQQRLISHCEHSVASTRHQPQYQYIPNDSYFDPSSRKPLKRNYAHPCYL